MPDNDAMAKTALLSDNSDALANAHIDGKMSNEQAEDIIKVDGKKTLRIQVQSADLVVNDTASKPRRTCGIGAQKSGSYTVPLYNILWAEVVDSDLHLDCADQISTTKVKVIKRKFAVGPGDIEQVKTWTEKLLSLAYGPAKLRKRAKVLINPFAGQGGARRLWNSEAKPIFEAARMALDVVETKYAGEAVEIAQALDIDAYDTIVACSGDGLAHEVFNGLGKRPDARRALSKIALSHIPCGSGNAMSCNLYGTHRPALAALAVVKSVETPMDLVSVTQGDRRLLSFLSQALGFIAEADLATEHLRWMGENRFTFGLIQRLYQKKAYPCDLAVKVEIDHKDGVKEHYRKEMSTTSLPALNTKGAGNSSGEDEAGSSEHEGEGLPPLKYGTINDELPDGWELVPHDKMGTLYCGNMAYMAQDSNIFQAACINDGFMDLVSIDGMLPFTTSLGMFMSVESGKFFDHPHVSYRKIVAYRIIPRNQDDGYISVDGERIPFAPFQAEIHKGLCKVLSKRGVYEAPGPANWDKVTIADRIHA